MPELPEVETVMRGLAAVLQGQTILRAETRREGMRWPFPARLAETLAGARVEGFRRRGKYMLMRLSNAQSVLIHLGMSGRMVARPRGANTPPPAHEHLMLETAEGTHVGFVDPRRFGSVDLVPTAAEDSHRLLAGMGPEPLEEGFTPAILGAALAGKQTPVKAALLDQSVVAGLGNIYVAEALFRAGISPRRLAGTIPGARAQRLVPAIRQVLQEAIDAGGSSLRDYVRADGELGRFQDRFQVYDREGQPCPLCPGAPACRGVSRITQGGRSTFFCARTQR
ncbi:bifunctional DNA-formamidopyrimidine glycosylase/DNA-(apurinic or apyrimidinic site) lyase [Roseomonas marmotae]|uniref:Formamidopyrimidine-DNA glycosylase n=1 Tax=Roseomonas marmotae TaxID=2768161 RepID=A0ABS3K6L4_9PROT|nr:bifunctional DNA-formamidopyrimidine glycosylase/DNA-(apurinic or apyrimidinic site) lyase [Roseomonas marmotae]MBO1073096.1 bifunctional DNA-formamidopyrimidine glycosylase/DNA-(apurinic or apyrimidinic site) lyase [Roseomonas marmotae]QTI79265.1 bifunctional DNA-formamidopyrimidine glycosylase/DNA-(apurinic or apyrimidinic site) lyase [Roseomonas marmotae]